jgi:hypothetical protein
MAKAVFLALSAAFFTAYAIIASALLIPTQNITPINNNGLECITQGEGEDTTCISDDPAVNIPFLGPILEAVASSLSVGASLFSGFFQLITFQANGLAAASVVTALIFVPLGIANAYIIFTAVRGST